MTNKITDVEFFEMVDATSDDVHYTLGLWTTLEAAIAELNSCDIDDLGEDGGGFEDNALIKIYQRKMGWSGRDKLVFSREYEAIYSDDDSHVWEIVEEKQHDKHRKIMG